TKPDQTSTIGGKGRDWVGLWSGDVPGLGDVGHVPNGAAEVCGRGCAKDLIIHSLRELSTSALRDRPRLGRGVPIGHTADRHSPRHRILVSSFGTNAPYLMHWQTLITATR